MKAKFFFLFCFFVALCACDSKEPAPDSQGEAGRWRAIPAGKDVPHGVMLTREKGKLYCAMNPVEARMWVGTEIKKATEQEVHFTVFSIVTKKQVAYHLHLDGPLAGDTVTGTLKLDDGKDTGQKVTLRREVLK